MRSIGRVGESDAATITGEDRGASPDSPTRPLRGLPSP